MSDYKVVTNSSFRLPNHWKELKNSPMKGTTQKYMDGRDYTVICEAKRTRFGRIQKTALPILACVLTLGMAYLCKPVKSAFHNAHQSRLYIIPAVPAPKNVSSHSESSDHVPSFKPFFNVKDIDSLGLNLDATFTYQDKDYVLKDVAEHLINHINIQLQKQYNNPTIPDKDKRVVHLPLTAIAQFPLSEYQSLGVPKDKQHVAGWNEYWMNQILLALREKGHINDFFDKNAWGYEIKC